MEQIAKRPRGRPATNKNIITKPAAQTESTKQGRGRPATNKYIVKQPKEIKATTQKLKISKPIDIPHIKELARDNEKKEYKQEMQAMLKERLRQGKLKVKLELNMIKLEERMNKL
jgi:transketolase